MKHKTAELEGALLDAAVEKIEAARFGMKVGPDHRCDQWHRNWAVSGPIIERERISTFQNTHGPWNGLMPQAHEDDDTFSAEGPTPLIAAMRAYVASRFGDEVELP
jgi:hypothetical protein